ncbi:DDE-type integrase/transposase/recombinase [Streptomyces sp. JNUCC 64]
MREPQAHRPADARARHPGRPPPQAAVADPARQEGEAGTGPDRPRLPRRLPGTKLVGDITALPTGEGWLYLACWMDLATREVVGYSMADHHRATLVVDALKMAAGRGRLQPGCIVHSDRGSEYTSSQFRC